MCDTTQETTKTFDPDAVRQIRTVCVRIDAPDYFDKKVNELLKDGWKIVKRYTSPSKNDSEFTMLVAELYKFINKNEVN